MDDKITLRGHLMYWDEASDQWCYHADGTPTVTSWESRGCGMCKLPDREDGHDACLGVLPGVMNACCGHGVDVAAYIQYEDEVKTLRGREAIEEMRRSSDAAMAPELLPSQEAECRLGVRTCVMRQGSTECGRLITLHVPEKNGQRPHLTCPVHHYVRFTETEGW